MIHIRLRLILGGALLAMTPTFADNGDPFRPFVNPKNGVCPNPDSRVGIRNLKLVAILVDGSNPRAILEDDAGRATIVTRGTEIARNQIVSRIDHNGISVDETIQNHSGPVTVVQHERLIHPSAAPAQNCGAI